MSGYVSGFALPLLAALAVLFGRVARAEGVTASEAEGKMFTEGAGYDRFMGRWSRLLAPRLIEFVGVRDGDRVLDVGTGTGALASTVEARMPHSRIVGIDPSAGFVAYARKHARTGRTRFQVGDAQALAFQDASFDTTLALLVMSFIPDHERAIAEMRRVTRPRGIVGACVWDYNQGMQSLRLFWDEAVALDPAIEPKDERHLKLSRQGQLGALWREAGLRDVREQPLTIEQAYASFDDYWTPFTEGVGPAGAYVAALPVDRRGRLEAGLRKRVLGGRPDGPFVLKARAWCVRGVVARPENPGPFRAR